MRLDFSTGGNKTLQFNPGRSTSMKAVLGVGAQGLPGPGAAAWTALQAVTTGSVRQAPDGSWIKSVGNRTTRASFDATEQTFWTATLATSGTIEAASLASSFEVAEMAAKYGVVAGSSANQTAAIEAALNAASARAVSVGPDTVCKVSFPGEADIYCINVEVPEQVEILTPLGARFRAFGPGYVFDVVGGHSVLNQTVIFGGGSGFDGAGIRIRPNVPHTRLLNVRIQHCDGRGVYDEGIATEIDDLYAINCLLDAASLSTYTGVLELAGTDAEVRAPETSSARNGVANLSASGFAGAIAISGANNRLYGAVAEFSDFGIATLPGAIETMMYAPRTEFNQGHGLILAGGDGVIVAPKSLNNSRHAANTYDGIICVAASAFEVVSPVTESRDGTHHRYGIRDQSFDNTTYNRYWNAKDFGATTAPYSSAGGNALAVVSTPGGNVSVYMPTSAAWTFAGQVKTTKGFRHDGSDTALVCVSVTQTNPFLIAKKTGDAADRFVVISTGEHRWGDGTNPQDVYLYRAGADWLKTDDRFQAAALMLGYVAKTAAYTITTLDTTVNADATAGAFSVTLPTSVGKAGQIFIIRKSDASGNAVTVATTSSQTINGSTTYALSAQYAVARVQSDGANWMLI